MLFKNNYNSFSFLNESCEHFSYVGNVFDDVSEIFVWMEIADDEDLGVQFVV